MSVAAPPPAVLTAEEFVRLPDDGRRVELVAGKITEVPMPPPKHGFLCMDLAANIYNHVRANDLGRVASNDSWVKTKEGPDTVRGADIAFWSHERLPQGEVPEGIIPSPPDLVIEVRSPSERWTDIFGKMLEYLKAGVRVACILDAGTETLSVYRPDEIQQILTADDEFTLPDVLPGFQMKVGNLFT
jgi:Uma2 family endonuclease